MKNAKREEIAALFADVDSDAEIANILRCVGQHIMRNVCIYKRAYDAQTMINQVARDLDPKNEVLVTQKKRIDDLKIWNKKQEEAIDKMANLHKNF